ncbi:hypothetical protein COLSTE_01498 [Collinsella stercoris DSM 13279]|uniref:Uncharacterized protein n=1 Tax=Collinsella stercoris DSM 13279 TaxID=445975 RepID=B6GBN4_9ACTN|nr:hypothetical protein COLSTE_01498 [Collinsella stercoris DSM 13279]
MISPFLLRPRGCAPPWPRFAPNWEAAGAARIQDEGTNGHEYYHKPRTCAGTA